MAYKCVHCGTVNDDRLDELEEYCVACKRWAEPRDSLSSHYRLDADHNVVPCSLREWCETFEASRQVADTETRFYRVSTVFLGLNHGFHGDGPPIVFETMTFEQESSVDDSGEHLIRYNRSVDGDLRAFDRYASWDDAMTGHEAIVGRINRWEATAEAVAPINRLPRLRSGKKGAAASQSARTPALHLAAAL